MTDQIPHPDDSNMTPEMLSDEIKQEAQGKETPENPEPEQKPEETPADKPEESPKPEDKPEDEKSEEKSEEKPEAPLQTKPRTIYEDLKDKKKQVREKDTEIETLKSQLAEKDSLISDLTEKAKNATTPAEKAEVEDEIAQLAEEIGADPEGIAKLTEFLTKKLVKPAGVEISPEDLEAIKNFRQSQSQQQDQAQFNNEWNTFEPTLKTDFPHVSKEELDVVKAVIDKLAHSEKYADKEVDYIYFKEKSNLQKLISPKRPSYEGGDNKPAGENNDAEVELSGKSSPMDAMKAISQPQGSSLEIRSSN